MKIKEIEINDLFTIGIQVLDSKTFSDSRGSLNVVFEDYEIFNTKISMKRSYSKQGVARGLHWQKLTKPQEKLISVRSGKILDFILDMTISDGTLYYFELDQNLGDFIRIPSRFAHGFIALEETNFEYLCVGEYSEEHECTINVLPSAAKVILGTTIDLSPKDQKNPEVTLEF